MLCLSLESPLRKGCIYLIESRPFQMLSLLLVVSSSVILGLYDPLASTAHAQRLLLQVCRYILVLVLVGLNYT